MNKKTGISIIVTFCAADQRHLARCLDSLQWQIQTGDQLILVYDGDAEHSALAPFTHLLRGGAWSFFATGNERGKQKGVSAARNLGWKSAKNNWIKFLDVDDLLAPFALNAIRAAIKSFRPGDSPVWAGHGNPAVIVGGMAVVHNEILVRDLHRLGSQTGWCLDGRVAQNADGISKIAMANPFLVSHCAIRKDILEVVGGFDARIDFEEDWDLWLKIDEKFPSGAFFYVPERICYYTIDDAERAKKVRHNTCDGLNVREYFKKTYGVTPQ